MEVLMHVIFKCSGEEIANLEIKSNFSLAKGQIVNLDNVRYTIWQVETIVVKLDSKTDEKDKRVAEYKIIVNLEKI